MTQEEKELVFRDMSARLLYNPKIKIGEYDYELVGYNPQENETQPVTVRFYKNDVAYYVHIPIDDYKPYLRPMSSMTKEEQRFIATKFNADKMASIVTYTASEDGLSEVCIEDTVGLIDWLNRNMFDYRGLIPKGLALVAREGMYKND